MRDKACPHCNRPLMEIDHYGEVLVGCIDCNCWGHPGDDKLIMELMGSDLEALKGVRHDGGYKSRHDWASHGADAFRVLASRYRYVEPPAPKPWKPDVESPVLMVNPQTLQVEYVGGFSIFEWAENRRKKREAEI